MTTIDLSITSTWPPRNPARQVGVAPSEGGDAWFVVLDNPLEIVGVAGAFGTEAEACAWVTANCHPAPSARRLRRGRRQ
jgi:hypothetical protein